MKHRAAAAVVAAALLVVAAPASAYRHWHGRFYLGIGPAWDPFWYPPAYPYYYPSAPVIVAPPTTYIQREAPREEHYWYYCTDPKGYYPYVKQCPAGWMKVVPQTPPH